MTIKIPFIDRILNQKPDLNQFKACNTYISFYFTTNIHIATKCLLSLSVYSTYIISHVRTTFRFVTKLSVIHMFRGNIYNKINVIKKFLLINIYIQIRVY